MTRTTTTSRGTVRARIGKLTEVPTAEERAHDFLWRVHAVVPAQGEIVLFNRSHYEDVLVARVHRRT